jgi:hypothetical protein
MEQMRMESLPKDEETESIRLGNGSISGELFPETGTVALHIKKDPGNTPQDTLRDVATGLKTLAHLLASDPKFHEVTQIVGTSWIFTEYPQIAKRYGFTIDTEGRDPEGIRQKERYKDKGRQKQISREKRDVPPVFVQATREAFLERWKQEDAMFPKSEQDESRFTERWD